MRSNTDRIRSRSASLALRAARAENAGSTTSLISTRSGTESACKRNPVWVRLGSNALSRNDVTYVPEPCRLSRTPSSSMARIASRSAARDTPSSTASSVSRGNRDIGANVPSLILARISRMARCGAVSTGSVTHTSE